MFRPGYYLLILCLMGIVPAAAMAVPGDASSSGPEFIADFLTGKDGLPEDTVTALCQTRDGYIWAGTADGLARFDGVKFHTYDVDDGLPHAGITALCEDKSGTLWVGTEKGLAAYDPGHDSETVFKTGMMTNLVTSLTADTEGRIWIGTKWALFRLAQGNLERMDTALGLPKQEIQLVYADAQGAVWVWGKSLKLFQIKAGKVTEVPVDFSQVTVSFIRSMLVDQTGQLWISAGRGYVLHRQDGVWLTENLRQHQEPNYNELTGLVETGDGTVWLGSRGLGVLNFQQDRFVPIGTEPDLSDINIRLLMQDSEGNFWAGTAGSGLICLRPKRITTLAANAGLTNGYIHSITEMADGRLAVATEDGILRQTAHGFERQPKPKSDLFGWTRSVLATHDGNLWWGADLYLLNWNQVNRPDFVEDNLPPLTASNVVLSLYEDRQNKLWVGMMHGLWQVKNGQLILVNALDENSQIQALAQAPDGSLWVGDAKYGVFGLQPGRTVNYTKRDGLGSDSILALHFDAAGVLWIGTRSGGLSRLKDNKIVTYTTREGLVNNTISQILEDDNNNLWLGSNRGISKVSKKTLDDVAAGKTASLGPLNLGGNDGMLVEQCTGRSNPTALKSKSGRLYFSTLKGIAVVDPKRFQADRPPPFAVIEEIDVSDSVAPDSHSKARTHFSFPARPEAKEIILPPGRNNVEIAYTALHSLNPKSVVFRYRLASVDARWNEMQTRRSASYTQLAPGHYIFHVQAANSDGRWSTPGATVGIYLRPYFYQTWWFEIVGMLGSALGLILLAHFFAKRRFQRRMRMLELQQTLENERRRIASDLHDEVGARLTNIAHLGELAVRNNKSSADLKQQVGTMTLRVQQLMSAMNEVVWAINPKNDSLPNVAAFLSDYTERFLAATEIRWRLEADADFPPVSVSAQSRHNLLLAAKETLNNAVRHGAPSLIQLDLHVKNDCLEVTITDNGRGFEISQARPGGNGLANLRHRMKSIHGQAEIRSQPGQGTTVTLTMPLADGKRYTV